ncbi:MAG TPA: hypothetical protein VN520_01795 [Streptomyces sp.]|uniref:hypothetical protein n=1 Tax=Streptomyces sp. TaxID=1931 RepID=UPI002BDEFB22|nr:hypothetical protein [Streptomyces sp.]HWU05138.1 hypothetical protein [Streptomyces sp.]
MSDDPCIYIGGALKIVQSNGYTVYANFNQNGNQLSGYCEHSGGRVKSSGVEGRVSGQHVDFTITWNNGSKGHYWGDLTQGHFTGSHQGILKGTSQDVNVPTSTASWEVHDRVFDRLVPA